MATLANSTFLDSPLNVELLSFLLLNRVSHSEDMTTHLRFNSQFESGNLRKAIQVFGSSVTWEDSPAGVVACSPYLPCI